MTEYVVKWKRDNFTDWKNHVRIEAENADEAFKIATAQFSNPEYKYITVVNTSAWRLLDEKTDSNPHYMPNKIVQKKEKFSGAGSSRQAGQGSLPAFKLPKVEFQDSGWILLYQIAGWICVAGGFLVLLIGLASNADGSGEEAFVFFFCALLAALANFFAAHILRLQEKTAAFTETTSEIMVKHHELMVENVSLLRSIAQKTEDKGE